ARDFSSRASATCRSSLCGHGRRSTPARSGSARAAGRLACSPADRAKGRQPPTSRFRRASYRAPAGPCRCRKRLLSPTFPRRSPVRRFRGAAGLSPCRPSCARFHRGAEPVIEQPESQPNVSRLRPLEPLPEQAIGVQRYGNALRRSRGLIAAIVLGLTALVLWVSLMLPKTYTAQATILFNEAPTVTATTDEKRQLATIQKLLMTHDMLAISAKQLRTTVAALASKVQATVDPNANIISISAAASMPKAAARTANTVAGAFLARERKVELAR